MSRINKLVRYLKNAASIDNIKVFDDMDLNLYNFDNYCNKQID